MGGRCLAHGREVDFLSQRLLLSIICMLEPVSWDSAVYPFTEAALFVFIIRGSNFIMKRYVPCLGLLTCNYVQSMKLPNLLNILYTQFLDTTAVNC